MPQPFQFQGEVDIPIGWGRGASKSSQVLEMLERLPANGKAHAYEFQSNREAEVYRSTLYTLSIAEYGEAGHIATRIIDTRLIVWRVQKIQPKVQTRDLSRVPYREC